MLLTSCHVYTYSIISSPRRASPKRSRANVSGSPPTNTAAPNRRPVFTCMSTVRARRKACYSPTSCQLVHLPQPTTTAPPAVLPHTTLHHTESRPKKRKKMNPLIPLLQKLPRKDDPDHHPRSRRRKTILLAAQSIDHDAAIHLTRMQSHLMPPPLGLAHHCSPRRIRHSSHHPSHRPSTSTLSSVRQRPARHYTTSPSTLTTLMSWEP